jgi:hypothetical protein
MKEGGELDKKVSEDKENVKDLWKEINVSNELFYDV